MSQEALRQELGAEEVVGFVPTGWLYEMRKETFAVKRKGACSVHLVPYSEHNSFDELREYVRFLRPLQVGGWFAPGHASMYACWTLAALVRVSSLTRQPPP